MKMSHLLKSGWFLAAFLLLNPVHVMCQDNNWTHFRGSELNNIVEKANIPLKWDESTIKWKTEIHDRGHSSPVVYGNQIWLTTATADGKQLYAMCVDYQTGRIKRGKSRC